MKEEKNEGLEQANRMKPERSELVGETTGRAGRAWRGFFTGVRKLFGGLVQRALRGVLGYVVPNWAPKNGSQEKGGDETND